MEKMYICFVCYKFHPEMRGVSEVEFNEGNNVCKQERCTRKGEQLEPATYCETCDKMYSFAEGHKH